MDRADLARLLYHLIDRAAPDHAMWNPSLSEDGESVSVTIDHGGRLLRASVRVDSLVPLNRPAIAVRP